MLNKNYYHRSFTILQSKDRDYGLSNGKEPAGYCKMEMKSGMGKAYVYVQDMKPGTYYVFLASSGRHIPVQHLCEIEVGDNGRGECVGDFDVQNIGKSGFGIEDFNGIAVVNMAKDSKGREIHIAYPLIGYANKRIEVDWTGHVEEQIKERYGPKDYDNKITNQLKGTNIRLDREESSKSENTMDLNEPNIEAVEEEQIESNHSDEDVKNSDNRDESNADMVGLEGNADSEEENPFTEWADMAEEPIAEILEPDQGTEPAEVEQEPEPELELDLEQEVEIEHEAKAEIEKESVSVDQSEVEPKREGYAKNSDSTYWSKVENYFKGLFESNIRIDPFCEDMGDSEWIRVQCPYYYSGYMYPDHYIIGIIREDGEVRYVAYGMPGVPNSMPPMCGPIGPVGFYRWLPMQNGFGMGYWMLYIDADSGSIAYPY